MWSRNACGRGGSSSSYVSACAPLRPESPLPSLLSVAFFVCAQVPEHVQMKSRTLVSQVVNFEQDNALQREMVWCPNWRCATTTRSGLHFSVKSLAERRRVGCTGCLPAAAAARPDSERAVSSARSSGLWWSRSPWTKRGGSRPRSSATRRRVRHRHRPTRSTPVQTQHMSEQRRPVFSFPFGNAQRPTTRRRLLPRRVSAVSRRPFRRRC